MKYKLKINLLQTMFMAVYWITYNYSLIPNGSKISDYDVLSQCLMTTGDGYNGSLKAVGLFITLLFAIAHNFSFSARSMAIVKYGRKKYVINDIKQTIINAFLFSLEYCGVNAIFTTAVCERELLISSKYFLLTVLYFLMRFAYFLVFASLLLFMYYLFKFKRIYMVISTVIMMGLNSLPLIMIERGIVLYAEFVNDWMQKGTFDLLDYIKKLFICVMISAILITGARLVFIKKDILINEEES